MLGSGVALAVLSLGAITKAFPIADANSEAKAVQERQIVWIPPTGGGITTPGDGGDDDETPVCDPQTNGGGPCIITGIGGGITPPSDADPDAPACDPTTSPTGTCILPPVGGGLNPGGKVKRSDEARWWITFPLPFPSPCPAGVDACFVGKPVTGPIKPSDKREATVEERQIIPVNPCSPGVNFCFPWGIIPGPIKPGGKRDVAVEERQLGGIGGLCPPGVDACVITPPIVGGIHPAPKAKRDDISIIGIVGSDSPCPPGIDACIPWGAVTGPIKPSDKAKRVLVIGSGPCPPGIDACVIAPPVVGGIHPSDKAKRDGVLIIGGQGSCPKGIDACVVAPPVTGPIKPSDKRSEDALSPRAAAAAAAAAGTVSIPSFGVGSGATPAGIPQCGQQTNEDQWCFLSPDPITTIKVGRRQLSNADLKGLQLAYESMVQYYDDEHEPSVLAVLLMQKLYNTLQEYGITIVKSPPGTKTWVTPSDRKKLRRRQDFWLGEDACDAIDLSSAESALTALVLEYGHQGKFPDVQTLQQVFVAWLQNCGLTVPGWTSGIIPETPVPGGAIVPDPTVPGGAIEPSD